MKYSPRIQNKKKILFISDFTFSHTIGGTEVATARLINHLAKDGEYEVFAFVGETKNKPHAIQPDQSIRLSKFLLVPAPGDKGFNNFVIPNPVRMYREIKKINPDLIHIHIPSFFGIFGICIGKYLDIPLVYTSHMFSEHFVYHVNTKTERLARKMIDSLLAAYMRHFDCIIHPSKIQEELIERKYNLTNDNRHISNGFIPFDAIDSIVRKPEWNGKTIFFSVSRLSREKNIHLIIDAFDRIEDSNSILLIVGDGTEREKLEECASKKSRHANIYFIGEKRGSELAGYYKLWDIFVSASNRESEWLTTLEAISMGKPIILSDASGNAAKQFVQQNGYLFTENSSEDLSQKMKIFLNNPELIEQYWQTSKTVAQSFDFQTTIEQMKEVYEEYIDR